MGGDELAEEALVGAERRAQLGIEIDYEAGYSDADAVPADLKQAMALMTYSRHRHLMVTEDAKLVGILSLGDIVKNLLSELELEKAVLQDIYMAAH